MKRRFDAFISKITMYRLMLYSLLVMAAYALALAFVGILGFNPLTMLIQLIVLIVVGYGVNYALAYAFGIRTNFESTFITSLILFFIFSPTESQSFVAVALIAAIASTSKYVLAWRRRHVFNPAAIAAVISGLTGLQYASWWVATGAMLPVVFILGGAVLYKTRRLKMGGIYVVTSLLTISLSQLTQGHAGVVSIGSYVTSWPLLFFAGFMLSEPLTLPPRRWQRYVLAAGVAMIANAGLSFGSVAISPEIGLVIGNVFGFLCGQRRGVVLKFVSRKSLTGEQVEYTFQSDKSLRYLPGQYLELHIPHARSDERGERRMFTISSVPSDDTLTITTRHYHPSSSFKKALLHLPVGARVKATGIYGDFILPEKKAEKLLMIAGGIGITPFKSQLEYLLRINQQRDIVLLYFVRSEKDAIYKDILLDKRHGARVRVLTTEIDAATVKEYVPDIAERMTYISGPPVMVDRTTLLLSQLGASRVITDFFSGY